MDASAGTAEFVLAGAHMFDYITFVDSVTSGGAQPERGVVSFKVTWQATGAATVNDVPSKLFRGQHAPAVARMEWSGRAGDYEFVSKPIATSSSPFGALLGTQRSGSFY